MGKHWLGSAAAAVLALAASGAVGLPVPDSVATYTLIEVNAAQTNYFNAVLPVGTILDDTDGTTFDDAYGFTQANYFGDGPFDYVQTRGWGTSEVSLKYYYEIGGPAGQNVDIDLTGSIFVFGSPYPAPGFAYGSLSGSVGAAPNDYYAQGCAVFLPPGCPAGENFGTTPVNVSFVVPTNTPEWIDMDASAYSIDLGSSFTAQVDPLLSIDPSVSNPQDYRILVSPDVQNGGDSAPLPEPATWAMLLCGVFATGAALRASRKRPWSIGPAA
jgi:hypothetical protein